MKKYKTQNGFSWKNIPKRTIITILKPALFTEHTFWEHQHCSYDDELLTLITRYN